MKDIAVDVVILPPESVTAQVIDLNGTLCRKDRRICLDRKDVLPHISLFMSSIPSTKLAETISRLDAVLAGHAAQKLTVTGVAYTGSDSVDTVSSLSLTPSSALSRLHVEVCDALSDLRIAQTRSDHFARANDVDEDSRRYVQEFLFEHAYALFDPHITVGFGRLVTGINRFSFFADRIALCLLGPYCTCRGILNQWNLGPGD